MQRKILFALLGLGLGLQVAVAGGISLSPMITEILLPPGSYYEDAITITNTKDEPVIVEARVLGFMAPDGIPILLEPELDNYPYSGRDLLTLEPSEQVVNPGETVIFSYRVEMPEEIDPYGGRYVAAVFKVKPPTPSEAQVVVSTRLAALFMLNPGGNVAPHLTITHTRVYQSENDPRKIILEALIKNDGNLHCTGDQIWGVIHVADQDGYFVDEFPINTHYTLPGTSHLYKETWTAPENLPSGTYQFRWTILVFGPGGTESQRYFFTLPIELNF
jgi:hypothetical protein